MVGFLGFDVDDCSCSFSCFFWGLIGFFSIGVVDPSALGWGLVPIFSFRVSLICFDGDVFWILCR